jgi:xanthine dehydrogenase YagR molybdenum-binding subunit
VVIAETLEAATEAANLLAPRYEIEAARVGLDGAESYTPATVGVGSPSENRHGDIEAGLASAARRIDVTYETPIQYHNAMEPHAIVAHWDGDRLSIDTPSQGLAMAQGRIAGLFGIKPENIHIRSPFLGGGFGSKGMISGPQVLGILAAKLVGKPVKLVLKRDQMYGPVGHRSASRRTHPIRSMRARRSSHRTKPCGSTQARRCSCARPARRPARSRWRQRSTRRRRPAAWTRSPSD